MTPKKIIDRYKLQHNDDEGGYFAPTFVSPYKVGRGELPGFAPISGKRDMGGSIYYFLDKHEISCLHRVTGDMIYLFLQGDPVEMLILYPKGSSTPSETCTFSNRLDEGDGPMKHIPGGAWLGSRVIAGGDFALMGVVMVPGFNPADYAIGDRKNLIRQYPEQTKLITALTKQ
jgi:predicted cupin superfamily sugar epimerase